ncbi:PAS domain-containing protein [Pseudaestuariivita atlantica]|uniref:PAS fold-4 domain-containing protein n=1 Tax=Pseudaestuariivita atlantica TaxID=1317121 RepID=A0A0L1JTW1_9RHOB|nr:PAS domain-containing protein [Pseudaestuariivita atlantica]KNG95127.1 hypothetical protein ATO11_00270 [Pseudaestuariivita atlantica]
MFQATDLDELRVELDSFKIPVFVAERQTGQRQFHLIGLNEAHERESGMEFGACRGKRVSDLLPDKQAEEVNAHYAEAIARGGPIDYQEVLSKPGGTLTWQTTVCPVTMPGGAERILGHALCVRRLERDQADLVAFEDVRYFSTEASFQLSRIGALFDAMEAGQASDCDLRASARFLAGMCRAVDDTLQKVRTTAENRLAAAQQADMSLLDLSQTGTPTLRETAQHLVDLAVAEAPEFRHHA